MSTHHTNLKLVLAINAVWDMIYSWQKHHMPSMSFSAATKDKTKKERKNAISFKTPEGQQNKSAATLSDDDASQSLPNSEELCSPCGYICKRINLNIQI